jgi:hypothetical protein
MQPTFQRRVPVPLCIAASFGIAPAGGEPCASLHPVRFAVRRSRAASVVGSLRRAGLGEPFRATRCRTAGSALTSLSRSARRPLSGSRPCCREAEGRGRVHHVSVKEPWLVRPEMPSIVEKPSSGSAPVPRLCRRVPSPGVPSPVAVARFEPATRPPTRPRPDLRLGGRCHSPTSAIAKSTSTPASDPSLHRGEARERLVSLRLASCPAKRAQAMRQTEPKLRRRRSAAASTESTSSQRPRCGG